jgi:hypothetical protein
MFIKYFAKNKVSEKHSIFKAAHLIQYNSLFMFVRSLSDESKEIIKVSREIALDLGCSYISTTHFFLADCRINGIRSLKKFAFKDEAELSKFYEAHRFPESTVNIVNLPLTKEAEKVIRKSAMQCVVYSGLEIFPCHIFLAAAKFKDSIFYDAFPSETDLYGKLVSYYSDLRAIDPTASKGVLKCVIQQFPFRNLVSFRLNA